MSSLTTLNIRGMRCAGCVSHVEKGLLAVPGVAEASVNLAMEQATVRHDPATAGVARLIQAVRDAGYDAEAGETEGTSAIHAGARRALAPATPPPSPNVPPLLPTSQEGFADSAPDWSSLPDDRRPPGTAQQELRPPKPQTLGPADGRSESATWRNRVVIGAVLALPVVVLGMGAHAHLSWGESGGGGGVWHSPASAWIQFLLAAPVMVLLGGPFFRGAWKAARHARADMDSLVALGTSVAFLYSVAVLLHTGGAFHWQQAASGTIWHSGGGHELYFETAVVILVLIGLGKSLEAKARAGAAAAIRGLMDLQPPTATVRRDGREQELPVDQVVPGDVVLVRPGQRIPVDGQVLDGASAVDQSLVTGESMPVEVAPGSAVIGGTVNQTGAFRFRATRTGKAMLLAQVVELVKRAQGSKARVQRIADSVAGVFVPVVLLIALLTLAGWVWLGPPSADRWATAMSHTVAVLIVACPCALGLATPTAVMVGTGLGARQGILIKDAAALERAGRLTHVVLDKTGTLTVGTPAVTSVLCLDDAAAGGVADENAVLALAAAVEERSEHPLGRAIVAEARRRDLFIPPVTGFASITGGGVRGHVAGREIAVGKPEAFAASDAAALEKLRTRLEQLRGQGQTAVVVAAEGTPIGIIALADQLKPGAKEAVAALHKLGLKVLLMTGDHAAVGRAVAAEVGIDEVLAGVLPQDKQAKVVELQRQGAIVAMVGDGINDAPALAAADIGIAIGGQVKSEKAKVKSEELSGATAPGSVNRSDTSPQPPAPSPAPGFAPAPGFGGTDIAADAGHVVLVGGDLAGLPRAILLSCATMRRIYAGLFWAFLYNVVLIPVAAAGYLHPMLAALAMAFSSVSVVLNALYLRWAWGRKADGGC